MKDGKDAYRKNVAKTGLFSLLRITNATFTINRFNYIYDKDIQKILDGEQEDGNISSAMIDYAYKLLNE